MQYEKNKSVPMNLIKIVFLNKINCIKILVLC